MILVIDSGGIIKSDDSILKYDLITVQEVLQELKDKTSKQKQDLLKVVTPQQQSLQQVVTFSKKTGDFASLSVTDLRLLALAYETAHQQGIDLKQEPQVKTAQGGEGSKQAMPGFYDGPLEDDQGWITPESEVPKVDYQELEVKMACMTTDFAMQNVLLQMGIPLLSVDNIRIKEVKSFVLRCHACFSICKNMDKRFCPKCGGQTLIRTSYSIDENGQQVFHLKRNFQYRLKGTIHSLPTPQGGQHAKNVILREDQKENIVQEKKLRRQKDKIDNDIDGFAPFTQKRTFRK